MWLKHSFPARELTHTVRIWEHRTMRSAFCLYIRFDMYMSYGWGVSPWKFSPTVKGSRCQGHSLAEIKTFLSIKVNTSQRDNTMRIRQRACRNIYQASATWTLYSFIIYVTSLNACSNMHGPTYRVARFVLRIPELRVTSDHAYVITLRHIQGTTLFLIREKWFAFFIS